MACYDPDSEHFQTICKIGTGFSEEVLSQFYDLLKPLELEVVRGDIEVGGAKPDVWFEPKIVWEVLTADLSLSPVYTAAHGLVSPLSTPLLCHTSERFKLTRVRSIVEESRYDSLDSLGFGMTSLPTKRLRRNKSASSTNAKRQLEVGRRAVEAGTMISGDHTLQ